MPSAEDRMRQAHAWLDAHYPCEPVPYPPDKAVELLGLAAEGYMGDDVLAWVMPSRAYADIYARAARSAWGRQAWVLVDPDGQVVQVTGWKPS